MNFKDKIMTQAVACMTIVALLNGTPMVTSDEVTKAKERINNEINKHYSIENIKAVSEDFAYNLFDLPGTINNVIEASNEVQISPIPIDKNSKEGIKNVRAAAGGEVIYAGIDKDLGVCVRIKNSNKIYTYGNLDSLSVIIGERVIKSEIIGTYDDKSDKEFYYQLEDYMV